MTLSLLLVANLPELHSQIDPQTQSGSDSIYGQQSTTICQDGSPAVSLSDGSTGCIPSQRQQFPDTSGNRSRPNSVSSAAENADIQTRARSSQQSQPLPPEPLTEFQKFVAATTGQLLLIYGANLFRNVPSTFAPSDLAPAASDYVIGPDDELRIRIWGQLNYSGNLRVDRSGDIYLPEAGAVHVAGLPFSSLDQHLRSALSRVYRNFDLSADMGRIRSIQVYVTGQARRPGAYTVSSLSSLVDALFASGGPSAQGSLRHIELRRSGKTVTDFDLYALLIRGDKSKDAQLLPEDVLFIPPAGPQVAITGSIHIPGIYELRAGETIGDLVNAAGKTTAVASSGRISLERLGERQIRQAMEFPIDAGGLSTALADGDILRVYSVVPAYQKTVTLRGNVANPGRFAWHEGMKLSDLIPDRDSLMSRDYWWKRSHLGLPSPEFEPLISNLEANQQRPVRNAYPSTNVPGANNPYSSTPYPDNPYATAPYSNSLNPNSANPYNIDPTSPAAQEALTAGLAANERRDANDTYNRDIQGAQQSSGGGALGSQLTQTTVAGVTSQTPRTDVRLSAPEIDWNYAVIERLDPVTLKTSLVPFDLGKLVLNHDSSQDLPVQANDIVTVFSHADIRVPLDEQTKYVRLEGEFVHAGIYSAQPGETLRDLVRRAGGLTSDAYLYGSEFDRESTRILQQQRIDEYVRRVDLNAQRGAVAVATTTTASAGITPNTSGATTAERELIARLRQIRATGRIVLTLRPKGADINDLPEFSLENGDRFTVPPVPATINVVGAVYDQNSFLYQPSTPVGSYLKMAGGPDRDADKGHSFVIRADGSVVSRPATKGLWGNTFNDLVMNPGDTVVIPDKTLRPSSLRGLLDWTQIFSQLALGAAAINVLR
jgi:protein involved in polysaccharide export with SLBB domain